MPLTIIKPKTAEMTIVTSSSIIVKPLRKRIVLGDLAKLIALAIDGRIDATQYVVAR